MSGDYSRHRFDPRNNYTGVKMQQGRVQLDADWNEWTDVIERRSRAETVDTFGVHSTPGIPGVAVVSPLTPDAFKIEVSGGTFTIAPGRMYVDGLLADNFGSEDGPREFDPVLAELRGLNPVAYAKQPYHPDPADLPGAGPHLAYLEVWQREVTHLQRPDLVEKAISVDTTTRVQTVWQVRLLENVTGSITCTSPDADLTAAWKSIISPSAGRLSSRAIGVPPDVDPCELPPSGGYRGLENQLYRIEIHDGGGVGTATFKWSRDNASVAAEVIEVVAASELKLASLGRDSLLRFNTDDWVEIIDDWRELSGEAGDPAKRVGLIRQITVNDAKQTISFSPALPADLLPTGAGNNTLEKRHLRVIRWDQRGIVRDADNNVLVDLDSFGSGGVIPVPVPGVWVNLEHGVQVRFSSEPAPGEFRGNDFWTVAARTSDASVEVLTNVPPQGIHRHYARLALVTFPDEETDCRVHWPPSCGGCCTVTVSPGESIQAALDSLPEEGGCVCLKTGIHYIDAPIAINGSNIRLCGEGPGAIVRTLSAIATLLQIGNSESPVSNVAVEDIRFEAALAAKAGTLLFASHVSGLRIARCELAVTVAKITAYFGMWLEDCRNILLEGNRLENVFSGIQVHDCLEGLTVIHNVLEGVTGKFLGQPQSSLGEYGIRVEGEYVTTCHLEHNYISHFWNGIYLQRNARRSLLLNNRIHRTGGMSEDNPPTTAETLRQYLDSRFYAICIEAETCRTEGNLINLPSPLWGGIRSSGPQGIIAGNSLLASGNDKDDSQLLVPGGIYCHADHKLGRSADNVDVRDNTLAGPQTGIVISRLNGATVESNFIDGTGSGWFGIRVDECKNAELRNNTVEEVFFAIMLTAGLGNKVCGNRISGSGLGIASYNENYLEVIGNTVFSCLLGGIILFIDNNGLVLENRVVSCGYAFKPALGIAIFAERYFALSEALIRVEGCEVLNTGISADGKTSSSGAAIGISGLVPACRVANNRTGYTLTGKLGPAEEHRALLLCGPLALQNDLGPASVTFMFGSATIVGNKFTGPGHSSLAQIMQFPITDKIDLRFRDVTFSNNVCEHLSANVVDNMATVDLWGGALITIGNHVTAFSRDVNSISLGNRTSTLFGNITTGNYIRTSNTTPAPILNFNIRL